MCTPILHIELCQSVISTMCIIITYNKLCKLIKFCLLVIEMSINPFQHYWREETTETETALIHFSTACYLILALREN